MNITREGRVDLTGLKYVAEDAGIERLRDGDVLFNNTNSPALVGKTAVVGSPGNWAFSNHMTRLRTGTELMPEFLARQLHFLWTTGFFKHICINHVNQAGVPARTLAQTVPIVLPPVVDQCRIVEAIEEEFSRLDVAEATLQTSRRHLENLRASVLRLASAANGDWTTLGEIAEIVGGVTKDSQRENDPSFVEAPYLRVANVQRGHLDLNQVSTIRVPKEKARALRLEPGDILFNEGGDRDKLGRGWVWQGEIENCIHQNHVFRARLTDSRFDPKFVSIHGNTFGSHWFERMGKQTTNLASINLRTLKAFPIPVLPVEEQRSRVLEAERQTAAVAALTTDIDRAERRSGQLRSAVLAAAFAGGLA